MFSALLRTRFQALYHLIFAAMRKSGRRSKLMRVLIALLAVYVVAALLFTFGMLFYQVGELLAGSGMTFLIPLTAALISVTLCVVGSIYMAQTQVFEATDNELLLSMPVPPGMILLSRLMMLWIVDLLYTLMVMLPAAAVYAHFVPLTPLGATAFFVGGVVLLPLLSLALTCLFGWLVALITVRLRRKNLITSLLMLAFFGGYLYLYSGMQRFIGILVTRGASFAEALRRALPPVYHFAAAVDGPSLPDLALLALWCVLPSLIVYWLLSRAFLRIVTTRRGGVRRAYRETPMEVRSPRAALLRKELARYFSLPMYIFNTGFGALLQLALAVALLIQGPQILQMLFSFPGVQDLAPLFICAAMSFCAMMTCSTYASLSLEGTNFWILRAHPLSAADVFFAKIAVNLLVGVPAVVLAAVAAWIAVPMSLAQGALVLLLPLLIQICTALFGLAANLWMPRFSWINETAVIKQSGSSMVAVLGGMALIYLLVALYFPLGALLGSDGYLLLCCGLYALLVAALAVYLRGPGRRRYESL